MEMELKQNMIKESEEYAGLLHVRILEARKLLVERIGGILLIKCSISNIKFQLIHYHSVW